MPQISATVRQPVIDTINELAKQEKRSFSEMVAVLLEKAVYEPTIVRESVKNISTAAKAVIRGGQSSDPVQQ